MPHPRFSGEEIERRGEALYKETIRARVASEENVGKILSIDIETGEYTIGDDVIDTAGRLLERNPGAAIWTKRIGYNAVYAVGGSLSRVAL